VSFGIADLPYVPSFELGLDLYVLTFLLSRMVYAHLGRVILRWSSPAYHEHLRWQSFRRFLAEFSAIRQAPIELSSIWQEYYVYAVALGIGERFMQGLSSLATAMNWEPGLMQWGAAGFAGRPPDPQTCKALALGIEGVLGAFRSGSGLHGKRASRLQPSALRRAGKQQAAGRS